MLYTLTHVQCTHTHTHTNLLSVAYFFCSFIILSKQSQHKDDRPHDHSTSRDERKRQHSPPPSHQPATKMARNLHEHSEEKRKHSSHAKYDSKKSKTRREKVNSREQCWMASHLRVRIIDQEYQRGKYYNNKVPLPLTYIHVHLCKSDC